jgi:uncharacterized protein HemX
MSNGTRPDDPDAPHHGRKGDDMGKKKRKGEDEPKPAKVKRARGGGLKKVAAGLLVVGVLGGGAYVVLEQQAAAEAAAADAVPYATGTELAAEAYQAFRAQGVRIYEIECPGAAEKELGQVTTCSAQDETGTPIGVEATTVENPVKRFAFQRL